MTGEPPVDDSHRQIHHSHTAIFSSNATKSLFLTIMFSGASNRAAAPHSPQKKSHKTNKKQIIVARYQLLNLAND